MSWLVRERPDVRCDYAVNEGGGVLLELADGRRVVTIAAGEKRTTSARLRVKGRAGHASVPAAADNPVGHAARAVELLLDHGARADDPERHPARLTEMGAPEAIRRRDGRVGGRAPPVSWPTSLPPMTRLMVTPTGLRTHEPANVIPPYADVICDCRALPGQTEADIRAHVDGRDPRRGATTRSSCSSRSRAAPPRPSTRRSIEACRTTWSRACPAPILLPLISTGFTDSHWVREAHETVAYGFAPVFATELDVYDGGMHGADESIAVEDLVEMTEFNLHAIRTLS